MTDPVEPFAVLGLGGDATADDVRSARRSLAKAHHPDRGGEELTMQRINEAAVAALASIEHTVAAEPPPDRTGDDGGVGRDAPSFTVEALPVDAFEALMVVAALLGEVLDDDPPYRLDTYLAAPFDCWCGIEVVPDAGGSTVSLAVAGVDGAPTPDMILVRDAWITELNELDWP